MEGVPVVYDGVGKVTRRFFRMSMHKRNDGIFEMFGPCQI